MQSGQKGRGAAFAAKPASPLGMVPDVDDGTAVTMSVEVPVDAPFALAQYVSVLDSERGEEARAWVLECSGDKSQVFVYFFWSAQTCRVAKEQVRCASPVLGAISLKDISLAGRCHEGRICRPELFVPTADERAYWTVIAAESYRLESNARVAADLRDRLATLSDSDWCRFTFAPNRKVLPPYLRG